MPLVNSCKATLSRDLQLNSSGLYIYIYNPDFPLPTRFNLALTWSKCEFGDRGTRRLQIESKLEVLAVGRRQVHYIIRWIDIYQECGFLHHNSNCKQEWEWITCAWIFLIMESIRMELLDHVMKITIFILANLDAFELFMTNFNCTCLLLHEIQSFSDHCLHACWFCFKVCGYSHLNHWKCYSCEIAIYIEQSQGGSECEMDLFCYEMGALELEDFFFWKSCICDLFI